MYQKLLDKHFLVVQCIQTGSMMAIGDVVAQTLIEKKKNNEFESMRTVKFGLLGVCFVVSLTCYKYWLRNIFYIIVKHLYFKCLINSLLTNNNLNIIYR